MDPTQDAIDYLGRRQPLGQQVIGGLPISESAFGGEVTAPMTPGFSTGIGGSSGVGSAPPLAQIATSPTLTPESQSALSLAARTLGAGQQGMNWWNSLFGNGGEVARDFSGGELAGGLGAASFGADVAPSWSAVGSALGAAGPIWAGLTAAVDLLGEGKLPFQGLIESLFGIGGPSEQWMNFGGNVRNTLQGEELANETLGSGLLNANTPEQQQAALGAWRQAIGALVPGWGKDAGPWELPDIPGAGGTRHEWKTEMDFGGELAGLRALLDAARQGQPIDARRTSFLDAARQWQSGQDAIKSKREQDDQEWLRTYDPGTGAP